jgi:large subunit ribosomal protein L28
MSAAQGDIRQDRHASSIRTHVPSALRNRWLKNRSACCDTYRKQRLSRGARAGRGPDNCAFRLPGNAAPGIKRGSIISPKHQFQVRRFTMSRVCQVTGKAPKTGNTVSHANNRKRRRFLPNLHTHRFWLETEKRFVSLRVTTRGLRTIEKRGVEVVVADLRAQGVKV